MSHFCTKSFRNVLSHYATGIGIVTVLEGQGQPHSMTINSFTSVSLDPPLVLFCVKSTSRKTLLYQRAQAFCFSFLREDQENVALCFAKGQGIPDGVYSPQKKGFPPRIQGALAHLEATRHACYEAGDHHIVVCRVENMHLDKQGAPLVFYQSCFHQGLHKNEDAESA